MMVLFFFFHFGSYGKKGKWDVGTRFVYLLLFPLEFKILSLENISTLRKLLLFVKKNIIISSK